MISSIDSTIFRIGNLDKAQNKLNFQLGGEKLQHGSDDSVLYSRLVHVDDKIKTSIGIQDQIHRADILNKTSDTSIKDVKLLLEKITEELIKANTATTSLEGLAAIAQNISGLKQNLFDLANTSTEGQYVFAGSDASVKPFEIDAAGKVTYQGDADLRKIAVDEGSYRERGVNGIDLMFYVADSGLKGDTLTFKEGDRITDQDGKEWVLDTVANTISKTNWDGSKETISVTPPVAPSDEYTAPLPNVDGTKFEARRNVFDMLDTAVNSLRGLDNLGNPVDPTDATANYAFRREGIANAIDQTKKAHDAATIAHADLGAKNKTFEVSLERLGSKITQLSILRKDLGDSDLTQVAANLKALEISYAAMYSTINRTFELSLVNFMR